MKNRTIAKLLVCSTILANLPVAAMANEVQQLAEDVNKWTDDGQGNWTYSLQKDTNLWGDESGTYTLASDSTYKIVLDTNVNVGLGSKVKAVETNDTTSKLTIEGKDAAVSNFDLNGYTITGDVAFRNVNVKVADLAALDRANTDVNNTVTINETKVVSVHAGEGIELGANTNVFFKNSDKGTGFALEGEQVEVTVLEGYELAGGNTVTVKAGEDGTMTITAQKAEESVWVPQADGSYVLDTTKLTGVTTLEVPASETTTTYTIPAGTSLDVTNVEVGKGSVLRIDQSATFTQDVDFALGGRLIAQTTTFQGQVWFKALTSNTRVATLAAEDGTVELEGVTFENVVNIGVPTTTVAGATTEFKAGATVNADLVVQENAGLSISGAVTGASSITAQGTLTVNANADVSAPIVVQGGTATVEAGATVGEVNVTAGTATVDGTASKVVVTGESATMTVGAGASVDTVEATGGAQVSIAKDATVDNVITDGETSIEGYSKFGIQFQKSGEGSGILLYGEESAGREAVVDDTVYINKQDTEFTDLAVKFAAKADEGSKFVSATINGTEFTTPEFAYTIAKDTTVVVNVQFDLENGGTTDPDEPGTEEPGENQVAYIVNIGNGGSVTYKLAGDAVVKTLTSGSVNLTKGGNYTLNVTAAEGYEIDAVTVDGTALTGTNGAYQFTAKSEGNGSIAVTFKTSGETPETQVKYTASVGEGGTVTYQEVGSTAEAVALKDGESVTLTKGKSYQLKVEADSSYEVDAVKVNGSELEEKDGVYTFTAGDADGTIAVTFSYVGGGSIGGGGSGGGSTGGGSSTSGTTSTVTVSASTSVSSNVMTATVSASNMEKAIKDVLALAEKNDTTPVVKISLSLGANIEGISVNLPTEALKALAAVSNAKLTIESSVASVTFDANALSDVLSQAGETFTLNAGKADMSDFTAAQLLGAGEGSVFDLNITSDGTAITNFSKGTATVTLPYALKVDENASDIVVYYMADNGILDSQSTQYDAANRKATFTTSHFSIYVVDAAWANPFNDVYEGDWFYNAVRYANENSLMAGVSDTTFAPNMNLTRAMVVQMLYSLEGKPAVVSGGNFSDVKASDWYADAVNWAASKGIVSGYSETTYAPNDSVTREQLSLILYKYAQSKNVTVNDYSSLSGFVDAAKTSDWAEDAVEWAVGAGLISSTSTSTKTLDPTGTATRAQVAQIVANFVEQVM